METDALTILKDKIFFFQNVLKSYVNLLMNDEKNENIKRYIN